VGHRIVFGGVRHIVLQIVTASVLDDLRSVSRFAPEHMPATLETLDSAIRSARAIPHVVCFDTAFHHRISDVASRLPLSQEWYERGVRRYGFHGLSYEYIVSALGDSVRGRVVIAHLGHGADSLAELLQRQPGIEITQNGGPGATSGLFMRGTNTNQVVVLVDGLRVSASSSGTTAIEAIPLADIDHIEILRGPASSIYGSDAIGGVVQVFTRKGGDGTHANASAGYGRYDTVNASAGFDLFVSGIVLLAGILVLERVGATWPPEFRNLAAAALLVTLLVRASVRGVRSGGVR